MFANNKAFSGFAIPDLTTAHASTRAHWVSA